jgi:hypothetical protein
MTNQSQTQTQIQNLKTLILNNGTYLVSIVEEVYAELGEPNCKLVNPCQIIKEEITSSISLKVWPDHTTQRAIMISSEHILTLVEPSEKIINKYLELTAE